MVKDDKQGMPIICKGGDAGQKCCAEVEDILHLLAMLDLHKVNLPRFVAEDLDKIPSVPGCCQPLDCHRQLNNCTNNFDTVPVTSANDRGPSHKKTLAVHATFASGASPSDQPMYQYYICYYY